MQGQWKLNLGGWNSKDTKRKSQTRNQYLNDRGLYYSRKEPKKSVRLEYEVEKFDEEPIYKKSGWVETWRIETSNYIGKVRSYDSPFVDYIYSKNLRTAFYNGRWYDEYSGEEIKGDIKKLSFLWKEEIQYQIPTKKSRKNYRNSSSKELLFVNNKPVPDWKRWSFYNDGKRRKFAQKYANSMDRQNIRSWISKQDWEEELTTHALSKSIAWEIH